MNIRVFLLSTLLLTGCATSHISTPCQEPDWYEIGRRDGASGEQLDYSKPKRKCSETDYSSIKDVYRAGRAAGLAQYCSEENAFVIGRAGLSYSYVCPSTLEETFLGAFKKGYQIFHLE